jgi:hypothetical protein
VDTKEFEALNTNYCPINEVLVSEIETIDKIWVLSDITLEAAECLLTYGIIVFHDRHNNPAKYSDDGRFPERKKWHPLTIVTSDHCSVYAYAINPKDISWDKNKNLKKPYRILSFEVVMPKEERQRECQWIQIKAKSSHE